MILENSLKREHFGYARILVADYHQEYPLKTNGRARVQLVWDPFNIGELVSGVHNDDSHDLINLISQQLFGPLEQTYGQHYEAGMALWTIQGDLGQIGDVFLDLAQQLMGGSSGDDDTFDYWPNAFEMLMEIATDLITLGYYKSFVIGKVSNVIASAYAVNGPLETWEAEYLLQAVPTLETIEMNHAD